MIGLIRQELLSGLREQAQFDKVQAALAPFRDEPLETVDYEEAARFYNECRTRGVHCGTVDILICAVAFRREWTVLSNDSGLNRCIEVMESLRKKRAARVRQP
jgi:predicted nucleic acid-binding protein